VSGAGLALSTVLAVLGPGPALTRLLLAQPVPESTRGSATASPAAAQDAEAQDAGRPRADGATETMLPGGAPPVPAVSPPEPGAPLVGETVVTASRAARPRSEVPADVTVLDRADLEQSASPLLDDVLRRVPDVATFRRSSSRVADPSSQGLNLRGVGPSAVSRALVLVDGLPLNDPFGGWVYWQSVPGLSIGSVEIVPGGSSVLYGTSALGGVVNVRSRPLDVPGVEADVSGDTLPSLAIGLRGVQRAGPVAVELTSEFLGSNGYIVVAPEQRGRIDVPAGSTHVTLQGRLEAELSPTALLGAKIGFFDERQNGGTEYTNASSQVRSASLTLALGPREAPQLELAGWFRNEVFRQQRASIGNKPEPRSTETLAGEQRVPADDQGFSVVWHGPPWGVQRLDVGADLHRISGTSFERLFPPSTIRERNGGGLQLSAGVFVQDTLRLGTLTLVPALRFDHWHNDQGRLEVVPVAGEPSVQEFPLHHESQLSPRLGALWQVIQTLALRASVNHAFRAPTLGELYRPFTVGTVSTAANPALAAETLLGAEAGVEWTPLRTLRARATAFWNELHDPITNVTLVAPVPPELQGYARQRQNLGKARVQGLELAVEARPAHGWEITAGYTLVDSRVLEADLAPGTVGKRLPLDPVHRIAGAVEAHPAPGWTARVQGIAALVQYEDDLNTLPLGTQFRLDAYLARALGEELEVYAAVENVLDRRDLVGRAGVNTIAGPITFRLGVRLRHLQGP